jgi:hypothetical protein
MLKFLTRFMTLAAVAALAAGCGNKLERQAVSGTVTYKGKPITRGTVTFAPAGGAGPTQVSAPIEDGKFSIAKDAGPIAGKYVVRFEAFQQLIYGPSIPGEAAPQPKKLDQEPLPAKYGAASKYEAEVKADDPNVFEFKLD